MVLKKKATTERQPLDRERILRAAVAMADSEGIEALSMRKLGKALGVEAMSLYNHVANKEEVLQGIVDLIVEDIGPIDTQSPWQDSMRRRAVAMRQVFIKHPWALGLMEARREPGPTALAYCDSVLGVLARSGFSTRNAVRAFSLMDSYCYGFSIQEKSMPYGSPAEAMDATQQLLQQAYMAQFPYLTRTATCYMEGGFDYTQEFEAGLDLLLQALETWRTGD